MGQEVGDLVSKLKPPHGETPYPKTKRAERQMFDDILEAGRVGKSHAQIAEMIGIGRDTLKTWLGEKLELARVMMLADDYALAWWEALGQRQAETREGNSSVFMFIMKNRFGLDYGNGEDTAPPVFDNMNALASLSPEKRNALRALLRNKSDTVKRSGEP